MRHYFLLLLMIYASMAHAQNWNQTFDGGGTDYIQAMTTDSAGNVYTVGTASGPNGVAIKTIVYNSAGTIVWQDSWLRATGDNETAIAATLDKTGHLCVLGTTESNAAHYENVVLRFDPNGGLPAEGYFDADPVRQDPSAIATDDNGDIYICGTGGGSAGRHIYLAKFDHVTMTTAWTKSYSFGKDNGATSLKCDALGRTYLLGFSQDSNGMDRAVVLKHDSAGSVIWKYFLSVPGGSVFCRSLAVDSASNVYFCGKKIVNSASDAFAAKLEVHGTPVWIATFDGTFHGEDGISACALDTGGNLFCAGSSQASSTVYSMLTLKINPSGVIVAHPTADLPADGEAGAVDLSVDKANRVYVLGFGRLSSTSNGDDFFEVGYDTRTMALVRYGDFGGGFGGYQPTAISSVGDGHVVFAGTAYGTNPNFITVQTVEPPIANPETYLVNYNHMLSVTASKGFLANDFYVSGARLYSNSETTKGSLFFLDDGEFSYTPKAGAFGLDTWSYSMQREGFHGNTATVTFNIVPALASLAMNPTAIPKNSTSTGTITLSHVSGAGGTKIALRSTNPSVLSVPSTVTVLSGHNTVTFTATSHALAADEQIIATWNGITKSAVVTVQ
jgi:hypothetical protein